MRTFRLPDELDDFEKLSDFVVEQVKDLESYVLVGDSFGAVIAIALATRCPRGLQGLIVSDGFAKNPITSSLLKLLAALAPLFSGPGHMFRFSHPSLYSQLIRDFLVILCRTACDR